MAEVVEREGGSREREGGEREMLNQVDTLDFQFKN